MMEEKKVFEPAVQSVESDGSRGGGEVVSAKGVKSGDSKVAGAAGMDDGFVLNPKYKTVVEQAKAYDEAQKAMSKKSQALAEAQRKLDDNKVLLKSLGVEVEGGNGKSVDLTAQPMADVDKLDVKYSEQLSNIERLYKSGQVTLGQAVRLKEHLDMKMNDSRKNVLELANSMQSDIQEMRKSKAIEGFKSVKPDFFCADERFEVIEYLKSASDDLTSEELEAVAALVEKVEAGAIARFKIAAAQDEIFDKANEQAKVRLRSSVEGAGAIAGGERVFTKDEIKAMSNKEFRQNEAEIMSQMRAGKILG